MEILKNLRFLSIAGYASMVLALIPMAYFRTIFSRSLPVVIIQILAVALMVWARITFGSRSFHYAANPTQGGLVTSGPYKFVRHPIYAAIALFVLAGVTANTHWMNILLLAVIVLGIGLRIYCEERLIRQEYPEYDEYAKRTRRIIPFVF